jgi:branched-chain amino acid transport system substrate-binding protein
VTRAAVTLAIVLAALTSGCGGDDDAAAPVDSRSCSAVLYEGEGTPDAIVVSDLPRGGIGAETSTLMVAAIKHVLRDRGYRAGALRIGYQSCNDTVGDQPFDEGLCERNARAYASAPDVLGVIGPWNSGCAAAQLPLLSRKAAGPLAVISPSNTFAGLTRPAPGGYPGRLYPDGVRNYVRVVPSDGAQGAVFALLAQKRGLRRVVALVQSRDDYGSGLGTTFLATARGLGLDTRRVEWRQQPTYAALARRVARWRPQLVYLAGPTQANAKRLLEELRGALGSSATLTAPDAFASVAADLGPAGEGLLVSVGGVPTELLPPEGKEFLRAFGRPAFAARGSLGAPEAAQAAGVLLDAIGRSDGTRSSVVDELFRTKVTRGILGTFGFDRNGDIVPAPVGILRFHDGAVIVERVVRVPGAAD